MKKTIINHLFIICIFMLPVLVQGENVNQSDPINEIQDSIQRAFNQKISDSRGDSIKQMEAYYEYGKYLDEAENPEKSIAQFTVALRIARNISNEVMVTNAANYLANMYASIGDFKSSNEAYIIALEAAKKTNNSGEIAKISMNLASNYNFIGEYEKAIKYGLYALEIKETKNNLERICYHYIAMGNIFRENNNTAKWEEYVKKAYKMKDVEGCASLSDLAKIYNSLGGIAVQKEEFEKALLYYDTLMILSREANFNQGISTALNNSAGVYKQLDNFTKALELSTESEKYFRGNPYEQIFNNNFKAELYKLMGQYQKGLALVNKNIRIEEINYYSTEKLKCLELLYELNFKLNNYDEAFSWNDSLRKSERILRDEDIRQSIEEQEAKYQTKVKEQQISLLTAENEIKNQRMEQDVLIIGILLILVALILVLFYLRRKKAAFKESELQQQLLRSQMNPHFIFNVMGSIQGYLYKNEASKAADYLSRFAALSRSVLNFSSQEKISLKEEIEMLQNYIELERARMEKPFDIEYKIEDDLETEFIEIPPMLLQPFVENAIKHGFDGIEYQGKLSLCFKEKSGFIAIEILDNGSGLSKQNDKGHKSKALEIFYQRKKGIEHKFKKEIIFEFQDLKLKDQTKHGIRVYIQLPILNVD